jgi:poly(A) polymerase
LVFVVGGTVRDRWLGRATSDIDLVYPGDPTSISAKLAAKLKGKAFPLDEERGIIRVALEDGVHLDIARQQGSTLEEDLDRRDFTINALAVRLDDWTTPDWKKKIVDRHKGLEDLKKKQLRVVSKGAFTEDPLRLLRAFRLAAELDATIESSTLKLISKHKKLLTKPAPERVREEMLRLFCTPNAYRTLVQMDKSGLLDIVFPEAKALRRSAPVYYGKGGVLKHTLESVHHFEEVQKTLKSWFPRVHADVERHIMEPVGVYPRYAHLKWGLLLHDIGKPETAKMHKGRLRFFEHEHVGANKVPDLAQRYRWSNDETSRYAKLVRNHMRPGNLATNEKDVTDRAIHRFFRDLGDDAVGMLLVSLGDHLTYLTPRQLKKRNSDHEKITIKMINRYYESREKILPPRVLNGNDIMKTFKLKPSPYIGELLKELTEAQSEGKVKTKQDALEYLRGKISHDRRD